ncbi:hypothetical protein AKO1_006201 [Acrasis kona]|uniref:Uncharacterized protein n=1 Tax=Acrasis kona TaxID=1008807 RepID=A0AAW2YL26_9EUKA
MGLLSWLSDYLLSSLLKTSTSNINRDAVRQLPDGYTAEAGIIWMTGQNNAVGDPNQPEAAIPYLYEQANVLNTLLKNADAL